jgi:hypothetical protein
MSLDIELRKAAAHINKGRKASARAILTAYLQDFPESDLAWLLMSYALDDPRLQQASAIRALRLNPENEQAKDRINQLLQILSPTDSGVKIDLVDEVSPQYSPDDDFFQDQEGQISIPFPALEMPGAVTSHAASSDSHSVGDFPIEAFLALDDIQRPRWGETDRPRIPKSASVLIGAGLVIVLIVASISFVRFFPGLFMSEEDAIETAVVQTATVFAIHNRGVNLPSVWTPTITPTFTITPVPSLTPIPTTTPTPVNTRTPRPSPTPEIIDPTIVAEMELLQEQVSEIRELTSSVQVNSHLISDAEVKPILESYYFYRGGSAEEIRDTGRVLVALGLIEPDYDLTTNTLNSLTTMAGGFYLQDTNQIFIVGEQFTAIEKFAYAHEFNHALVNLNVNLNGMYVYPRCQGNEDRCKAIQGLIGGDSALSAFQWLEQSASSTDYEEIKTYQSPVWILPDGNPPPYALRNREFPSSEGRSFVEALFSNGGWPSVTQAYYQLPESTEQILHPEKYFYQERPATVPGASLEMVLGSEWLQIERDTLGEWMTYLILGYGINPSARLNDRDAAQAAEGWGGDHYQVYYNDQTDETLLVVHWKWDQPSDANEFTSTMKQYLENRFSEEKNVEFSRECWSGNNQFACLYHHDIQSLWILAPSIGLVDSIQALFPDF